MKRALLLTVTVAALVLGSWHFAGSQSPGMGMGMGRGKGAAECPLAAQGGMGPGMMGQGMMGRGMGGPMMMGGCPLMMPGVKLKVEKVKNGAAITITSDDEKTASRIQKMAEIMRLQHELNEEMAKGDE